MWACAMGFNGVVQVLLEYHADPLIRDNVSVSAKEPCAFLKEPHIFVKEPYISAKQPYISAKDESPPEMESSSGFTESCHTHIPPSHVTHTYHPVMSHTHIKY